MMPYRPLSIWASHDSTVLSCSLLIPGDDSAVLRLLLLLIAFNAVYAINQELVDCIADRSSMREIEVRGGGYYWNAVISALGGDPDTSEMLCWGKVGHALHRVIPHGQETADPDNDKELQVNSLTRVRTEEAEHFDVLTRSSAPHQDRGQIGLRYPLEGRIVWCFQDILHKHLGERAPRQKKPAQEATAAAGMLRNQIAKVSSSAFYQAYRVQKALEDPLFD